MEGEKEVGFALFFHNFSTFLGRCGIYLEDLYIMPQYRGKGYGDFFTRSLMNIFIDVTDYIVSEYVDDYFLKFGFVTRGDVMVVESEKLTFPRKCQCGK